MAMRPSSPRGAAVAIRNTPHLAVELRRSLAAETGRAIQKSLTREHWPQRLAAEHVDVQVRHFLAAALADVAEDPVALGVGTDHPRHLADSAGHGRELGVPSLRGEVVPADIRAFWDDQDVDRRQRVD